MKGQRAEVPKRSSCADIVFRVPPRSNRLSL